MNKIFTILILGFSFLAIPGKGFAQDTLSLESLRYDKRSVANGWQELNCYSGNFQLQMPGKILEITDSIETEIGKMPYYTFFFRDEDDFGTVYVASYCEYPKNSVHSDSTGIISDFFATTMDAARMSIHGDLVYSDDTNYQGYPGKIWRIDYKQGTGIIRSQAFLIKNKFYTLSVISDKIHLLNKQSEFFFDSFEIF